MEEKEYTQKYYGNQLCGDCIHLFLNNGEKGFGCRAFPDGIPLNAKHGHNHHVKIDGQIGDYVFQKAKYEDLSPFAKYLYNLKSKRK